MVDKILAKSPKPTPHVKMMRLGKRLSDIEQEMYSLSKSNYVRK